MIDTKKLREIAEVCKGLAVQVTAVDRENGSSATLIAGVYVQAFNPTTALELLDRIDALEEQLEHYKELADELADSCNHIAKERNKKSDRIDALEADNQRLIRHLNSIAFLGVGRGGAACVTTDKLRRIAKEALNSGIKPEKG